MPSQVAHMPRFQPGSPHGIGPFVAAAALIFFAPILTLAAAAILLCDRGPVLVRVPQRNRAGAVVYRTEFRTQRSFDAETYDACSAHPAGWLTPVGRLLRATGIARLPALLDVRAGRLTLRECLRSTP